MLVINKVVLMSTEVRVWAFSNGLRRLLKLLGHTSLLMVPSQHH
nr:MAG: hypothetical protein H4Bulk464757_000001 [Mitovirus sp.]